MLVLGLSTDIVFTTWNIDVGKTNKQKKPIVYLPFCTDKWEPKGKKALHKPERENRLKPTIINLVIFS